MQIMTDSVDHATMRHAMVASQLRPNSVRDQRVVAAMAMIAREDFVPVAGRHLAYRDTKLPLGNGRALNLPMATGRLLTEANLEANDRVLLVGAATGYTAAVLADIVANVVALEVDETLATRAREALADYANITVVTGDLASGHAEDSPYDVLIVDGAVESLPDAMVAQVRPGGRVVSGIVERGVTRLASGARTDGGFALTAFVDSDCVELPGFTGSRRFTF